MHLRFQSFSAADWEARNSSARGRKVVFLCVALVAIILVIFQAAQKNYTTLYKRRVEVLKKIETYGKLQEENQQLRQRIADLKKSEAIETEARSRLGFVRPNDLVIVVDESPAVEPSEQENRLADPTTDPD